MIYVVEDDRSIRDLVGYALETSGLPAQCFPSGKEFFAALDPAEASLTVLDIMLPGQDGLAILRRLRTAPETAHIPVVIISALGEERDKVKGLDLGADDYIAKPFGIQEFLARVRACLRRGQSPSLLEAGALRLYPESRRVTAEEKEITLTAKEFSLLEYLLRRAGRVVSREELLGAVWGYSGGEETRTVDVHIRSLRQKLGGCGGVIATVRGSGYRADKP